jgi:hypothetical protein
LEEESHISIEEVSLTEEDILALDLTPVVVHHYQIPFDNFELSPVEGDTETSVSRDYRAKSMKQFVDGEYNYAVISIIIALENTVKDFISSWKADAPSQLEKFDKDMSLMSYIFFIRDLILPLEQDKSEYFQKIDFEHIQSLYNKRHNVIHSRMRTFDYIKLRQQLDTTEEFIDELEDLRRKIE